jgi:adenosine deaminase
LKIYLEDDTVKIEGNITSIDDYLSIKNVFQDFVNNGVKEINIFFIDAVSITSSVIGFMLKLINIDKVSLTVVTGDKRLLHLFDELELSEVFKAQMP